MKSAKMFGIGDVRVVEGPEPHPEAGEVLLRVKACAVCASDLHLVEDGHSSGAYPSGPLTLGHEFSGEIAAVGAGVTDWAVGETVACEPSWHCSHCDMCLRGLTNLCRNVIFPSYPDRDGALAEYIACPAFSLARLPQGVDFVAGALAEPLGIALHCVRLAHLRPGQRVAVVGCGGIGFSIMLMAMAHGITDLMVADSIVGRQTVPASLGAKVAASAAELLAACQPGEEPEVVFEAAGGDTSFAECLELARPAGEVVVVGIPSLDEQRYSARVPRRKELTIQFCRRSRNTLHDTLAMLADRRVDASVFPTGRYALDEAPQAIQDSIKREGSMLRAVVCP
jgi:L-iditol 2-dehydrogenase